MHEQYGIGQYVGITTRKIKGKTLDYLHVIYNGGDELYVPLSQFQLVRKYVSKEGVGIKLSQLGSNKWKKQRKVSKKVEEIAARLVELYAKRNEILVLRLVKMMIYKKNLRMPLNMRRHQIKLELQKKSNEKWKNQNQWIIYFVEMLDLEKRKLR